MVTKTATAVPQPNTSAVPAAAGATHLTEGLPEAI
jgi:hypothetical protein